MNDKPSEFEDYFAHLTKISLLGGIYKKYVSSPILFCCARRFGNRMVEVGSGTGSGILGAFPKNVHGLEINPNAVKYCKSLGLKVQLINENDAYPVADGSFDVCVLDNVLEHIETPRHTLDECYRITKKHGGLVIAVPGLRGFESDPDHKTFYDAEALRNLDKGWSLQNLFTIPFLFKSEKLSRSVRQYCLTAIYKKN